jgi:hypothetical protein
MASSCALQQIELALLSIVRGSKPSFLITARVSGDERKPIARLVIE